MDADPDGPAALMMTGEFCGHGEPTFTVFDLVLDGSREFELSLPFEPGEEPTVQIRSIAGQGDWKSLFSIRHLFPNACYQPGGAPPQPVMDEHSNLIPVRAAIGFEYPPDAASVDEVSWIAIAIEWGPHGERDISFSYETA